MRSDSDTETDSAVLPPPTTANEKQHKPSTSDSVSNSATTVAEKEWVKHEDAAEQEERMNNEVLQLARRFTTQSHGTPGALFPVPAEGPLNPASPNFNARKWAKAFYDIRTDTSEGNPPKTTGIAFKDLNVFGFGTSTDYQKSVGNVFLEAATMVKKLAGAKEQRIDILHDLEGVVHSGEMLAVLGPPGSGCSTLLRTIAGDTHGFHISDGATINYQGIHPKEMRTAFRGEAIYTAEVDHHFPHLTVGDTLYFAARARCPKNIPEGVSRREYAEHLRDVTMAMFGISHTKNTRVGDDFVRGVSGGERKRVTIAEAALSYSPLQCWDNSTRGLDSANALEFCRTLRLQADVMGCTSCVAIYQASQDAYDVFDKVVVLYEGRQIFFGKTTEAKAYFEGLGFVCPEQQTTADFLTSMTSHQERVIRPGWEGKTPRSPDEFAQAWKASQHRTRLLAEVDDYLQRHPFGGEHFQKFLEARRMDQSKSQRAKSPFTLSYTEQMNLTLWRSWVMLKGDPSITLTMLITNIFEALIISSLFYNLPTDTSSFFRRAILLFFTVIINAFGSILEIMTLYAKRKIVEKHSRYALYHPSAEALSAMIVDLPYKIFNAILMNTILYFMGNLRREPGAFFFFLLISFTMTLSMSMMFRLIGSVTKSVAQALAPASIILLLIALYTGFAIPPQYMQDWLGWVRWINPVFYGLESVMLNEFVGRNFPCSTFVPMGPGYASVAANEKVCSSAGSVPGQDFVSGTTYLLTSYGFKNSHRWRNFGVLIAYTILFMGLHLIATEYVASERSKGEVLVFSRAAMSKRRKSGAVDVESGATTRAQQTDKEDSEGVAGMEKQTSVFHWKDVCYDIKIKGEPRRILDHVDGWVKPGTLTALMGVSGAGKTTLLDVLATRVTMGVITGEMLVNGQPRDSSFQRKTGYVTQQDLHLHTSTVREALNFSALLRQPATYSRAEKLAYVDTVIALLGMEEYSDAVIGEPGEGLNVEQRKRLTIGVELAARPQLLLFLDEPTSGLDSQTSWSICNLMEKLTKSGQAILCTIHQPSAMLFQRFDRLLLLARGGRTVYFGEIGKNSQTLVDYFVRNGGPECPPGANPAEYMLEVIGAAPGAHTDIDWPAVWRQTPEYQAVQDELTCLSSGAQGQVQAPQTEDASSYKEFAAGFGTQFFEVTKRVFQQYWRSPSYIYSKGILSFGAALFIGLSFLNAENTQRGLQNQMFGVFIFLTVFSQVVEQIMPVFVSQRTMYEARERPSKAYSWKAFLIANILVEMAWNSLASVFCFVCWYFPIGLYRNAYHTDATDSRGITMFLLVWIFFVFTGSFAHMMIAGLPNAEVASGIVNLFAIMMFAFCGILAGPNDLPGFWIFMYRVNPFTYVVEGFLGTSLANAPVHCATNEFVKFSAPSAQTCGEYMAGYIASAGGYLENPDAGNATECSYCAMDNTNAFLKGINVDFANRWRNFGLMWAYCIFNIAAAALLYWLLRMPKKSTKVKKE
ncbi:ZEB2-regulated ABC transporter 1 [Colletotrichum sp. SAR 10_77]|nr:ZEB2-regulated ABC transporter 1 [Colletotrichum sp. SAR 10_77]